MYTLSAAILFAILIRSVSQDEVVNDKTFNFNLVLQIVKQMETQKHSFPPVCVIEHLEFVILTNVNKMQCHCSFEGNAFYPVSYT